jgi:hypothetical protein
MGETRNVYRIFMGNIPKMEVDASGSVFSLMTNFGRPIRCAEHSDLAITVLVSKIKAK